MSTQQRIQVPPIIVQSFATEMQNNPGPDTEEQLEHPEAASLYMALKAHVRPDSIITIVVENPA